MKNGKQLKSGALKTVKSIVSQKCPHCGESKVFEKNSWFKIPHMKEKCDHCSYRFDREPGYFLGAMYVSYGLAVLQGIITFVLLHTIVPNLETIWVPFIILGVILILSRSNFKLSRVIYIHLFPW